MGRRDRLAFGLENTVTAGIISAKSRSLPARPTCLSSRPTSPSIGQLGGPLFNMGGPKVIRSTLADYSRTGGYMGLSFAVPIERRDEVKTDLPEVRARSAAGRSGPPSRASPRSWPILRTEEGAGRSAFSAVEPKSPSGQERIKTATSFWRWDGRASRGTRSTCPAPSAESHPGHRGGLSRSGARAKRRISRFLAKPRWKMPGRPANRGPRRASLGSGGAPLTD